MNFTNVMRAIALALFVVHSCESLTCQNGGTKKTKTFPNGDTEYCDCSTATHYTGATCEDFEYSVSDHECTEPESNANKQDFQYEHQGNDLSVEKCIAKAITDGAAYTHIAVSWKNQFCLYSDTRADLIKTDKSDCNKCCQGAADTNSATCTKCGKNENGVYSVWTFEAIDTDDQCASANTCHSTYGQCVDGLNTTTCVCDPDYNGATCSDKIDNCSPDPCAALETCVDGVNADSPNHLCCGQYFNGTDCANKMECEAMDLVCLNGATCKDAGAADGDATCACAPDYDGITCNNKIDNCSPEPCNTAHGSCVDGTDGTPTQWTCTCTGNWNGTTCANHMECTTYPNYCNGHGTCKDAGVTDGDHTCTCDAQYHGTTCNDFNECVPDPCNTRSSTCDDKVVNIVSQGVNAGVTIQCNCRTGYGGDYCETDTNECELNASPFLGCSMPGTDHCIDGENERTCECATGWEHADGNKRCDRDKNECSSSPCVHGVCVQSGCTSNGYVCLKGGLSTPAAPKCSTYYSTADSCTATDSYKTKSPFYVSYGGHKCECNAGYVDDSTQKLGSTGQMSGDNQFYYNCSFNFLECNSNPCQNGGTCKDGVNLYTCTCVAGYTGAQCQTEFNECIDNVEGTSTPIVARCKSTGTIWCEDMVNARVCHCQTGWTGSKCESDINECASNPCANGGTCMESGCAPNVADPDCLRGGKIKESATTCLVRTGNCVDDAGGTGRVSWYLKSPSVKYDSHQCNCVRGYVDDQTQTYSTVHYNCTEDKRECDSDPCQNGATCHETILAEYWCDCRPGWTGTQCQTDIDECAPRPCSSLDVTACGNKDPYGNKMAVIDASSICPVPSSYVVGQNGPSKCENLEGRHVCTCTAGVTGANCDIDIDECGLDNAYSHITNPCNAKDKDAVCNNEFNGYTCTCSADWTDKHCDLELFVYELMLVFGGSGNFDVSSIRDIMSKSEIIVDSVPFLASTVTNDTARIATSWDFHEVFNWATYEGRVLDIKRDFVKVDDPTLGNCFTFNHENVTNKFQGRRSGQGQGLLMYLNASQAQYVRWVETIGYRVYIHDQSEGVYAETPSYAAPPGFKTNIGLDFIEYSRMTAPHGNCVTETSEVKSYYYPGKYSAEGCLRSCYQNELFASNCSCMDPRYPKSPDASIKKCELGQRGCVNDFVASDKGNPANWECVCPLPCSSGEYSGILTRSPLRHNVAECHDARKSKAERQDCNDEIQKNGLFVEVFLNDMQYRKFTQKAKMGEVDLMSQVGGILGILCGMSVFSITEIIFTIIQMIFVGITGAG